MKAIADVVAVAITTVLFFLSRLFDLPCIVLGSVYFVRRFFFSNIE